MTLGITLPPTRPPAANYVSAVISGSTLTVSGTMPIGDKGPLITGCVGKDLSLSDAQGAARDAMLLLLAFAREATGDLDRIAQCLRLEVFVRATPEFEDHPKVANGASNVLTDVLQERGRHARFAVGVASLPFGVPVEVAASFALR